MYPTHRHPPPRRLVTAALAALLTVLLIVLTGCTSEEAPTASATGTASTTRYDAATRDDAPFNRQFRHRFATVDGVRMHYVTGGSGPALVLLHGWPQTWFEWRGIMPALAARHTVYAIDLPGLGDSRGAPPSYDKATLARYVHTLMATVLGRRDVDLVGHDLGAAVAFRYAAQYPDDVDRLAYLDVPLPGPALNGMQYRALSWHIAFHSQPRVPETLVSGRVRQYLSLFYPQVAYGGTAFGGPGARSPFTAAEVTEYARTYSRPAVLSGGFDLYRTLDVDVRDNVAIRPIRTPTLLMTAEGLLASTRATLAPRDATITRAVEVPGAGHWLAEENPRYVTTALLAFFA